MKDEDRRDAEKLQHDIELAYWALTDLHDGKGCPENLMMARGVLVSARCLLARVAAR